MRFTNLCDLHDKNEPHSLQHGKELSFACQNGTHVELIKLLGIWKSRALLLYLTPTCIWKSRALLLYLSPTCVISMIKMSLGIWKSRALLLYLSPTCVISMIKMSLIPYNMARNFHLPARMAPMLNSSNYLVFGNLVHCFYTLQHHQAFALKPCNLGPSIFC